MGSNIENGAIFQELPDKSQSSGKNQENIIVGNWEKGEWKTKKNFGNYWSRLASVLSITRVGRARSYHSLPMTTHWSEPEK